MMSLQMQTRQEKPKRKSLLKQSHCPKCRSANLLNEGPDQFCCDCDWDTCAEYVERGLMHNLELAFREHFPKQEPELVAEKLQRKIERSA